MPLHNCAGAGAAIQSQSFKKQQLKVAGASWVVTCWTLCQQELQKAGASLIQSIQPLECPLAGTAASYSVQARAAFQHCWTEEHLLPTASVSQSQGRNDNRNSCPAGTDPARAGNGNTPGESCSRQVQPGSTCTRSTSGPHPTSHCPSQALGQALRAGDTSQQVMAKTWCSYLSSSHDAYLMTNTLCFVVKQAPPSLKEGKVQSQQCDMWSFKG